MNRALEETVTDEGLRKHLGQAFFRVADHMRNQVEPGKDTALRILGQPPP